MKTINLGLAAALILPVLSLYAQAPAPQVVSPIPPPAGTVVPSNISPGTAEVMRLAEAGTGDDVISAYIQNSTSVFNLSADQILYLRDIGLSSQVISAMLNRDNTLKGQAQTYSYDQKLYSPSAPQPPQVAPVAYPAPGPEPAAPASEPAPASSAVQAPPPVYVSGPPPEVTHFYSDLSPYGTWVQLDGVGWCWQPRVVIVNRAWQPYCNAGHWVYTDAGWYWASDYSWGWAPFHYGRWHLHSGCGWVWVPDRVWAPAWVIWRSEGNYCGWAPLPPHAEFVAGLGWRFNGISVGVAFDFGLRPEHYTFVALHDFQEHDFAHYRLPPTQVTQIYNHTTVINNYVVKNNTVINQGIKVDRVAAVTHTTIRPVHLRDAPAGAPKSPNAHTPQKDDLMVYRPQLKVSKKPVPMVAQKIDERHPVIQHQPVAPPANAPATLSSAPHTPVTANRHQQAQTSRTTTTSSSYNSQSEPNSSGSSKSASSRNTESPHETSVREPSADNAASPKTSNDRPYPSHSSAQNQYSKERESTLSQGSGPYYPKSSHQAAEAHALLPPSQPQGDRSSVPNSHTQPKKSDQ